MFWPTVLLLLWDNQMDLIEIIFCVAAIPVGILIIVDAMIDRGEL